MISKINHAKLRVKVGLLVIALIFLIVATMFASKYTSYPQNAEQVKLIDTKPENIKSAPKDRGGLQFQNQDKSVFDILEK